MSQEIQPDSEILIELSKMKMPFGKYKNSLLINLPGLIWSGFLRRDSLKENLVRCFR